MFEADAATFMEHQQLGEVSARVLAALRELRSERAHGRPMIVARAEADDLALILRAVAGMLDPSQTQLSAETFSTVPAALAEAVRDGGEVSAPAFLQLAERLSEGAPLDDAELMPLVAIARATERELASAAPLHQF